MKTVNFKQGTQEWLDWRKKVMTASDAPTVMGVSKFKKYQELLSEKRTGESKPVSDYLQKIFNEGHEAEEKARPIIEQMIGEELYPVVATHEEYTWLAASFDGITIDNSIIFEHKVLRDSKASNELYAEVIAARVPDYYLWQVYQQLIVSGAEKCLFVVSDGTDKNMAITWVARPTAEEERLLIDTWHEFLTKLDIETDLSELDEIGKSLAKSEKAFKQAKEQYEADKKRAMDFVSEAGIDSAETDVIKVCKFEKKGNVDYKSIPELQDVDCESYRKPSSVHFKVTCKS